mgnify:CR=1 FL=1
MTRSVRLMKTVRVGLARLVMTEITPDLIAQHGLSPDEYAQVLAILGRAPNLTELGIFSVMWSEHCSYKSTRVHLAKFPTKAPHVIYGPGENAGAIKIGKLNVDENPATQSRFSIMGIPTVLIFKGGEIVEQIVGLADKTALKKLIDKHV